MSAGLRLLVVQASWSFLGAQALGFRMVLAALFRDPAARRQVLAKYRGAVNTNPFLAGALAGIVAHYERRGSAEGERLFGALQSGFGSSGDAFFWRVLRPGLSVLAVLAGTLRPEVAGLFFLVPFAAVNQGVRLYGLRRGLARGRDAAVELSGLLTRAASVGSSLFAFLTGVLALRGIIVFGPAPLVLLAAAVSWLLLASQRRASYLLLGGLLLLLVGKLLL
jgi:mannose/fructose/N-acetylgalactosamine-specific phosphotransferase system component IID